MADMATPAEATELGGVLGDIPDAIGLGSDGINNFPANPDPAPVDDSMPTLPEISLVGPEGIDPLEDGLPAEDEEPEVVTPAKKEPEPAKAPEPAIEPDAPAKPERAPWDKRQQKVQQQAATDRKERERYQTENVALKERLDNLEAQAETRKPAAPQREPDTTLDLENRPLFDDVGDAIPNADAVRVLAQQNRELADQLTKMGENVTALADANTTRASADKLRDDNDAYFSLLDEYTKPHTRNEVVTRIEALYEEEGYNVENHPNEREMRFLIRGLSAEVFAEMPAPNAPRAKKRTPKAPTTPVTVGGDTPAVRVVGKSLADTALEMYEAGELFDKT